jgi:hypothetical protein
VRSDHPRKARLQKRLDRWGVWPRVDGGCNCARDTFRTVDPRTRALAVRLVAANDELVAVFSGRLGNRSAEKGESGQA